ncbi:MAG: hypothetical protein ACTSRU_05310 [Candidatus Hodarchaeales archaeon]
MIDEITDEQLNQLKGIAKQSELKEELEKLNVTIEELKVREEIEGADLSQDIQKAEKRAKEISIELNGLKISHPFIDLGETRKANIKRLEALEDKKDKVSAKVFNKLHAEYEEKIRNTEAAFQEEMTKMRELEIAARDLKDNIDEKKEEYLVRKELGELTEEDYNKKVSNLDKQLEKASIILHALKTLIPMYE